MVLLTADFLIKLLMKLGLKKSFALNVEKPSNSIVGRMTQRIMVANNSHLEKQAVELCEIQPHHNVLEVGFGPGVGLRYALAKVEGGKGTVYGVDYSPEMVENATAQFQPEINKNKLNLVCADVALLPFPNAHFDRIFHCNCFYFWPDQLAASTELLRVLKPNGLMITTLDLNSLKLASSRGILTGMCDPFEYMAALEEAGFVNVRIDYHSEEGKKCEAIFAYRSGEKSIPSKL